MGDKILVERIIETVKKHPVLYDSTLPCRKDKKDELWEEIADMFDMDVHVLRVKWKNLRDCYKKHLRAQCEDSKVVSSYKHWHWSDTLDFLRPHIRSNTEIAYREEAAEGNGKKHAEISIDDIKLEDDHTNFASDSETVECIINQPKLHFADSFKSDSDNNECALDQPRHWKKRRVMASPSATNRQSQPRTEMQEFDGIELIFLGYAKTVKNMPLKRQISIKMKIAKIMMEEELKCLE